MFEFFFTPAWRPSIQIGRASCIETLKRLEDENDGSQVICYHQDEDCNEKNENVSNYVNNNLILNDTNINTKLTCY